MAFASAIAALGKRGCVADMTANLGPAIAALMQSSKGAGAYAGFDPTAQSLHLGHASVIVMLQQMQRAGLKPYALVGGATALIGDPTGKREDRPLLTAEDVARNASGIRACLSRVLDFSENTALGAVLIDNADFYREVNVLDWLRDTGRHFRVSSMLAKDSVKSRLGTGQGSAADASGSGTSNATAAPGLSFTEFAYQIFQASDFARLHASRGVHMQVGGSDQWGNITAGVELIRRTTGKEVHGLTVPLLMSPDGRKFGKSEGNAVWLDPTLTSDHSFFQYLLQREDAEVGTLLRTLTTLPDARIEEVTALQASSPEKKPAQLALAEAVTRTFRGGDAVSTGRRCAEILFAGTAMWPAKASSSSATSSDASGLYLPQRALLSDIRASDLLAISAGGDIPSVAVPAPQLAGASIVDLAVAAGLAKSKGEARRLLDSGGLYWNWERVSAKEGSWPARTAASTGSTEATGAAKQPAFRGVRVPEDLVEGQVAVLSAGKKRMALLRVAS